MDEKTQCQALDRTQPSLPVKPGQAGTMTHDYKRHGTVDLFAAMNIATGEVLTRKRLRRGVDTSVADLTVWAEHWNTDPKPFIWKATAENIIEKVQRGRETLSQVKSETDHKHARTP